MEFKSTDYSYEKVSHIEDADASRKFIANVFLWMFVALGISSVCSFAFAAVPELSSMLRDNVTGQSNLFGILVMFAPLIFIFILGARFQRMSFSSIVVMFVAFSAIMGISLSYIFYRYSLGAISGVFITTSVVFGVMAIGGYITHQDLTKFGSIMIMLLIGIVVASLVNFFMQSEMLYYLISYIGAAVFIGLTAYDVQKLKQLGAQVDYNSTDGKKMAVMGALTLYLDFVNLFLFLLRIFGGGNRR